jgi:hypothetical protein
MLITASLHAAQKHLERISFILCLVNTRKFDLGWNPLVVKMSSVSLDISMCIAMMKFLLEIYVTLLAVGKHRKHCCYTLQLTIKIIIIQYEVLALTGLHVVWLGSWLKNGPV